MVYAKNNVTKSTQRIASNICYPVEKRPQKGFHQP